MGVGEREKEDMVEEMAEKGEREGWKGGWVRGRGEREREREERERERERERGGEQTDRQTDRESHCEQAEGVAKCCNHLYFQLKQFSVCVEMSWFCKAVCVFKTKCAILIC